MLYVNTYKGVWPELYDLYQYYYMTAAVSANSAPTIAIQTIYSLTPAELPTIQAALGSAWTPAIATALTNHAGQNGNYWITQAGFEAMLGTCGVGDYEGAIELICEGPGIVVGQDVDVALAIDGDGNPGS